MVLKSHTKYLLINKEKKVLKYELFLKTKFCFFALKKNIQYSLTFIIVGGATFKLVATLKYFLFLVLLRKIVTHRGH